MQTITLKIKNQKDYNLLRKIAERLGIAIIDRDQESEPYTEKRKWESIGSVDLKGQMDRLNIRDFAHE
jgi:hypothetical protein